MWKRKGGREKIEMNGFGKEEREEGGTFEIGGKEEEEEEEDVHCCFGHFPSTRIHCFVCSLGLLKKRERNKNIVDSFFPFKRRERKKEEKEEERS